MENAEVVFVGLLVAVAGLVILAGIVRVPYPVMLVVGGLGLGFVPGVPTFELDPDLVLLLFLPPLLYSAAPIGAQPPTSSLTAALPSRHAGLMEDARAMLQRGPSGAG